MTSRSRGAPSSASPEVSAPPSPDPLRAPFERFVAALGARNLTGLEGCLAPQFRLRAIVPTGLREREGASEAAALFVSWFETADRLDLLEKSIVPIAAGRTLLRYRFRESYSDGDTEVIEQNAICNVDQGRILSMDLVCSGHLPERRGLAGVAHRFDAGDLGCGSGLPEEFRRQIGTIPVGALLDVVTADPAAREDLPSLARLLGHRVVSVGNLDDGHTLITVRRER